LPSAQHAKLISYETLPAGLKIAATKSFDVTGKLQDSMMKTPKSIVASADGVLIVGQLGTEQRASI